MLNIVQVLARSQDLKMQTPQGGREQDLTSSTSRGSGAPLLADNALGPADVTRRKVLSLAMEDAQQLGSLLRHRAKKVARKEA